MKTTSVLFAGIGGQGIIRASSILATASLNASLDIKQSEVKKNLLPHTLQVVYNRMHQDF
jgi:hypothetical protein